MTPSATLAELKARSVVQLNPGYPLRSWISTARKTLELAEKADREGDLEAAYVGYRKMASLLKAVIEHKEYKTMTSTTPKTSDYFGYADLKSKVVPTTQRVRAIEEVLSQREIEHRAISGTSSNGALLNPGSSGTVSASVENIATLPMELGPVSSLPNTPNSTGSSNSGQHIGQMKPLRPPVPPASSKPTNVASSYSPTTPTSPVRAGGRVSGNLAARMAALYSAGMEGAGEHAGGHSGQSASSPTASSMDEPVQSQANGTIGLKRTPALHHASLPPAGAPSGSLNAGKWRQSHPPAAKPEEGHTNGLSPAFDGSLSSERRTMSPATPDDPSTNIDRPDSAPPAIENGAPNASGPATTQNEMLGSGDASEDYDFRSHRPSRSNSGSAQDSGSRLAPLPTSSAVDDFSSRFPDVDQAGFDFRPTESSNASDPQTRMPKPFHPAPQSTTSPGLPNGTASYKGRSPSISSARTDSTGGAANLSRSTGTNGYTAHQLQQAAASKPPPPAPPGQRTSRPPLPRLPSAPSLPNLNSTTILPADLWTYLETSQGSHSSPSILLLDIRTRQDFAAGHIKGKAVCLEPFTITPNSTAGSIESSLVVSPDQEKDWFADRASFDLIIIYDRSTKTLPRRTGSSASQGNSGVSFAYSQTSLDSPESRTIGQLFSAIYELNFSDEGKRLKRSPLLLIGGFEAWQQAVGEKGIQRDQYVAQSPALPIVPSLPDRTSNMSAKEAEYQAMLINRSHAESASYNQQGPPASSDVKKQHRKAVMSGDGLMAPIAPALPPRQDPMQRPAPSLPPPTYHNATITVPPVAIHRTGPASPYEAYPSTPFRGTGYGRQPNGEYFSGSAYSPPPQNQPTQSMSMAMSAYGMPPGAPQGLPYQPSRPVDYPSLQQRHRVENGSPNRPSPPSFPNAPSNQVQIPQPVLARAPQAAYTDGPQRPSLQLLQNASYLTSPQFGSFPRQLISLGDGSVGLTGLKNLGNTCYMNSMVQCLSATIPLARFLKEGSYKKAVNKTNVLGTKGVLADAVAQLIQSLWAQQYSFLAPVTFRDAICRFAPQFKGSDQHDSQEFLAFLLDGLHEDLNLVLNKPKPVEFTPEREAELEALPTQIAAEREWNIYLRRDDSIIVRLFQGQYKSQLKCLTCGMTSTTYNTFMYLSLPVPSGKIASVTLGQCIEYFIRPEILEGDDAWNCPRCKKPRRASKALTISRLPPILLIHLKRFSFHGPFTDKIDTPVIFPVRGLDLSPYMPPPLDPQTEARYASAVGGTGLEKAPTPIYDLHAISNHFGSLSSGHYTAYVKSRGHWNDLNDSKIGKMTDAQVAGANKSAYTLWYSLSPSALANNGRLVEL